MEEFTTLQIIVKYIYKKKNNFMYNKIKIKKNTFNNITNVNKSKISI